MKPKPFSALNHFTVPCATCAPTFRAGGPPTAGDGARSRSSARRTRTWKSNRARPYRTERVGTATPRTGNTGTDERDDGLQRVQRLEPLTGVQDDGPLRRVEPAVGHEPAEHRDGDPAGGLREDARRPRQVADPLHDLGVPDPADRSAGPADGVQG